MADASPGGKCSCAEVKEVGLVGREVSIHVLAYVHRGFFRLAQFVAYQL